MGEPFNQAKAIFLRAIEEYKPEQWPAFLERACAGDARLRTEVERLLRARSEMGSFHEATRPVLLAKAAAQNDVNDYRSAQAAVIRANRELRSAFAQLAEFGYHIS